MMWPQLRAAGGPGGLFPDPAEGCGLPAASFQATGLQNRERIKAYSTNRWVFVTAVPGGEPTVSLLLLVATLEVSVTSSVDAAPLCIPLGTVILWAGHTGPCPLLPGQPRATVCWALTTPSLDPAVSTPLGPSSKMVPSRPVGPSL